MGAGCYYTHKTYNDRRRAFWVELNTEEQDDELADFYVQDFIYELFNSILPSLGYDTRKSEKYGHEAWNGLYEVRMESTYYGDGIVIALESRHDGSPTHNLADANHWKAYDRLKRALLEHGYELRIATSGYTSERLTA